MNPKVSVIVCTHNPRRDYLGRTLDGLRAQTLDKLAWELVVIDNASQEPLAVWVDLSWQPRARLIEEPVLGVTAARTRGIAESVGDLLVFVDDDNVLAADYLERAMAIGEQWPQLGVWGGQQLAEYEEPPRPDLAPFLFHLTIRSLNTDIWAKLPGYHGAVPPGAGMCFRRMVGSQWHSAVQQSALRQKLGRTGNSLASGVGDEDTDLALTAFDLGFGTGLFQCLTLTHLIPASRLKEEYLLRLVEAKGFSHVILETARGNSDVLRKPTVFGRILRWYGRMRAKDRLAARFSAARQRGHDRAVDLLNGHGGHESR